MARAFITGGLKRIGKAIALHLAAKGMSLDLHYRTETRDLEAYDRQLKALGAPDVVFHQADLAQQADVERLAQVILNSGTDLLVNNASCFDYDTPKSFTADSWQKHLGPNLWAPARLSQALYEAVDTASPQNAAEKSAQGLIVNLLDQRVWNLTEHFASYTVSKAGLWTLTQTMALSYAPKVRVIGIGPGPTLPSPRQSQEHFDKQVAQTPLGVSTALEDICAALDFAMQAGSFTGQMIALDSGQHLNWGPIPANAGPGE